MKTRSVDPHDAVDFIVRYAKQFAKAKAERVYLEEFRKSKKAMLMKAGEVSEGLKTSAAQEVFAYAHPDYIEVLQGLKSAVEVEEALRFELIGVQARVEVWRSLEASNRNQDRATR